MWSITWPWPMRRPLRALGSRYGALVIDSMPPATMTSNEFRASRSCANIAAFIPEPHILFTVVQPAASGRPAPSEAWRAGAWPCPAGRTQPISTSCTSSGRIFARSTAARIAAAPSSGAANPLSSPWKAPIGVRLQPTMTIGSVFMDQAFQVFQGLRGFGVEVGDELRGGQCAGERHRLARPECDEVGLSRLGGSLAQLARNRVLRREGELRPAGFLHEAVDDAARRLAGEFFSNARVVLGAVHEQVLVDLCRAAFGAGNERRTELRCFRAERERGGDAGAIHDAARGDDRQLHCRDEHAREREGAGERLIGIAQIAAAMAAGLA